MVLPPGQIVKLYLVRHLPNWFPGAGFLQTAKAWAATLEEMVDKPYNLAKKQIVSWSRMLLML
jgi:hypothetical protein